MKTKCIHYQGKCNHLVCDRELNRRVSDRDYVEALDYLAELSADDQKYQSADRDFVKAHISFVTVK